MISATDKFKRKWNDIYADVKISIFDAVLGGEVEVDHPDGKVKVKIPNDCKSEM